MSIKPRHNGFEVYVTVKGNRFRRIVSTHAEATALENVARQALLLGKPVPSEGITVANTWGLQEAADKCYRRHWVGAKSEPKLILVMNEVINYFGKDIDIADITTELVDEFIDNQKAKRRANGTINRKLASLSKILRFAKERGRLPNGMPTLSRLKEGTSRIRFLSVEEEQQCLATLESWGFDELRDGFIASIDTGMRAGEMAKLTAKDILKEGVYLADRKNAMNGVVPLTSRARQALERRAAVAGTDKLFGTFPRSKWQRLVNHLELEDVVWHTLRHTTCSRLIQRGMPLVHAKEWMGHSAIQTTMRYAHLAPTDLVKGVSLLEQVD